MNWLLGLIVIVIGGLLIYGSNFLTEIVGRLDWAEKNLGGTRQGIVIGGFVLIIMGSLVLFGVVDTSKGVLRDVPVNGKVENISN